MIETIDDLGLKELDELSQKENLDEFFALLDSKLTEKLGVTLSNIKSAMSKSIIDRAEELALECPSIAPYENYKTLLEDNDSMAAFFKSDASKLENILLYTIDVDPKFPQLLKFAFVNKAVEDLKGTTYVSKSGVIRHNFPRIET
jgi:hypothetical protein